MKRLISLAIALLLLPGFMPGVTQPFTTPLPALDDIITVTECSRTPVTFLSAQTSGTDGTSFTFNNVAIGKPACAGNIRLIVAINGCLSVTNSSVIAGTVNGNAVTELASDVSTTRTQASWIQVDTGTTANFVWSYSGAADNTCEQFAMMLWSVITTSTTAVDNVSDASATGDFDIANVAVTVGGAEVVGIVASSADACSAIDPTFNGTETVIEDAAGQVETALSYGGGSFIADSTATADDYANISCGTETDGLAIAVSWAPPA